MPETKDSISKMELGRTYRKNDPCRLNGTKRPMGRPPCQNWSDLGMFGMEGMSDREVEEDQLKKIYEILLFLKLPYNNLISSGVDLVC